MTCKLLTNLQQQREKNGRKKMLEAIVTGFALGTVSYMLAWIAKQPSPFYMSHKEFVMKLAGKEKMERKWYE